MILGAGPAGLQLGYYLHKNGHSYRILEEKEKAGSFFELYPRRRELISYNKRFSLYDDPEIQLRWDWNSLLTDDYAFPFTEYSTRLFPHADEMVRYLGDFARRYALHIDFGCRIRYIGRRDGGGFLLEGAGGKWYGCRCLIVATGIGTPYVPDVPGIELAEGYEDVSVDPREFTGERVLIIGKGNSGFEIADNLLATTALVHLASPESIRLAWNTKHPGHVRGNYAALLDAYQLKTLNGALDCEVKRIEPFERRFKVSIAYRHAAGECEDLVYDRVIRCTGFRFDDSVFDVSCRPDLTIDGRFPAMSPAWECTNVRDMYFAGTLMQARDFGGSASAFIDGFRYNIRTLYQLLDARYGRGALPVHRFERSVDALTTCTLSRVCRSSGLWTQFGYLADVLVVDERHNEVAHYRELPLDFVHSSEIGRSKDYYTVTFEWGDWSGDVFAIERFPTHQRASDGAFLHPVVRHYRGSELVAEHHILEDLFGMYHADAAADVRYSISGRRPDRYHHEEHEAPLRAFFTAGL